MCPPKPRIVEMDGLHIPPLCPLQNVQLCDTQSNTLTMNSPDGDLLRVSQIVSAENQCPIRIISWNIAGLKSKIDSRLGQLCRSKPDLPFSRNMGNGTSFQGGICKL